MTELEKRVAVLEGKLARIESMNISEGKAKHSTEKETKHGGCVESICFCNLKGKHCL